MKKVIMFVVLAVTLAAAATVTCPIHPYASCYDTGQIGPQGYGHKWHCTCGDDVWTR